MYPESIYLFLCDQYDISLVDCVIFSIIYNIYNSPKAHKKEGARSFYGSNERLAKYAKVSESTVSRSISCLVKSGLLRREIKGKSCGKLRSLTPAISIEAIAIPTDHTLKPTRQIDKADTSNCLGRHVKLTRPTRQIDVTLDQYTNTYTNTYTSHEDKQPEPERFSNFTEQELSTLQDKGLHKDEIIYWRTKIIEYQEDNLTSNNTVKNKAVYKNYARTAINWRENRLQQSLLWSVKQKAYRKKWEVEKELQSTTSYKANKSNIDLNEVNKIQESFL